ncbi:hypothetical protein [Allorhizocola rhizosphaerae]|uniref:hypothetical protein n=1 Tax=Allorhizocola rhizosphaerae TaxID=1872709 RepID=UPI000E3D5348|nr:hypothetical protein [Allorhizocola rhizosphaerae]
MRVEWEVDLLGSGAGQRRREPLGTDTAATGQHVVDHLVRAAQQQSVADYCEQFEQLPLSASRLAAVAADGMFGGRRGGDQDGGGAYSDGSAP